MIIWWPILKKNLSLILLRLDVTNILLKSPDPGEPLIINVVPAPIFWNMASPYFHSEDLKYLFWATSPDQLWQLLGTKSVYNFTLFALCMHNLHV